MAVLVALARSESIRLAVLRALVRKMMAAKAQVVAVRALFALQESPV